MLSVSVIIPTFNCADSLPAAIRSVSIQDWPDLEIIIVDDGSTDRSFEVLANASTPNTRMIRQENSGPAAARNRGIQEATGEWIAFLDADDVWLPGKLDAQMTALARDPKSGFSYTDSIVRSGDSSEYLKKPRGRGGRLFEDLILGPQFAVGSAIVQRECFDKIGAFDTEMRTGEDWDMWLRLSEAVSGTYVGRPLVVINVSDHPGKYPMPLMERCTRRILHRLFSRPEFRRSRPELAARQRWIYAWHYSVLAKSYLAYGSYSGFLRMSFLSLQAHPAGLRFLMRRWAIDGRWPDLLSRIA